MKEKLNKMAKFGVVSSILGIIVITVLEFPPPIGFETRPQNNVSIIWLFFFLAIVVSVIATIPLIFKKPTLGKKLAIVAGSLNILQVIADQLHLLQPEAPTLGYSLLEGVVVILSAALIYFALKVKN